MAAVPGAVHAALVERLLGSDLAMRMGVVSSPRARALTASVAAMLRLYALCQRLPFAARYCEGLGRNFLKRTLEQNLAGAPADYQVAIAARENPVTR
jgi:hypothetical protein